MKVISSQLNKLVDYEIRRFKNIGIQNVIIGLVIGVIWLVSFYEIIRFIYPNYLYQYSKSFYFIAATVGGLSSSSYFISNFFFFLCYRGEYEFIEKFKTNPDPWPWKENPERFRKLLPITLLRNFCNTCVIMPGLILLSGLVRKSKYRLDLDTMPGYIEILNHIYFILFIDDLFSHIVHRLLHIPSLYRLFHTQHHEYDTTIGVASLHAHPLEYIFSNLLPSLIGALNLGESAHIISIYAYTIVKNFNSVENHCGYDFPIYPIRLLPLSIGGNFHDFHHSHNAGAYSTHFIYWDFLSGTADYYFKIRDEQDIQKKQKALNASKISQETQESKESKEKKG